MATTTNLNLPLDSVSYVRLRQSYRQSMEILAAQLGIALPVDTVGHSRFASNFRANMATIGTQLGISIPVNTLGVVAFRQSYRAAMRQIDAVGSVSPVGTPAALFAGDFVDDFETPRNIAGSAPGWTVISATGATFSAAANIAGGDGTLQKSVFSGTGSAIPRYAADPVNDWGSAFTWKSQWIYAKATTTSPITWVNDTPPSSSKYFLYADPAAAETPADYIEMTCDANLHRINLTAYVGGVAQSTYAQTFNNVPKLEMVLGTIVDFEVEVIDGQLRIKWDGVWLDRRSHASGFTDFPKNYVDVGPVFGTAKHKGAPHYRTNGNVRTPITGKVSVTKGAKLTITDDTGRPKERFAQPSFTETTTVTISGTYKGGEPRHFFCRTLVTSTGGAANHVDGTYHLVTPTITSRTSRGGTYTVDVPVIPDGTLDSGGNPEGQHTIEIYYNASAMFFGAKAIGDATAPVILTGTYEGTPNSGEWFYRVRDLATKLPIAGAYGSYQQVPTIVATGGNYRAEFPVPRGGPYLIDISYNEGAVRHERTSRAIICGYILAFHGQSNANLRASYTWTGTVSPGALAASQAAPSTSPYTPNNFYVNATARPGDTANLTTVYEVARILTDLVGTPIAVAVAGKGGSPLYSFIPGAGGANYKEWQCDIAGIGQVVGLIWDQGEAEAGSSAPSEVAGYGNMFVNTFLPAMRADTGCPTLKIGIVALGKYDAAGVYPGAMNPGNLRGYARMRAMQYALPSLHPDIFMAAHHIGEPHGDPYHYNGATYQLNNAKCAYSFAKRMFGIAVEDGMGASIQSATVTRTGSTSLRISGANLNGGTGLTNAAGTTLTGFATSIDGGTTFTNATDVALDGNDIVITGTGFVAGTIVRFCDNHFFTDSNVPMTTYADGRANIPMQPLVGTWADPIAGTGYVEPGLVSN